MDQHQQNGKADIADSQAASSAARDKLMDELSNAIGEAETWLKDAASQESIVPSEARERFEDTLQTARTDLRKLEESLVAHGRDAAQSADIYVHDNPWKAVGLGAALGVIVGLLIARK
jgi:ElaB/YqjD/DUF883 family membrane-anchored ribosome-binding protein